MAATKHEDCTDFILRNIPNKLHAALKYQAGREGLSMRAMILQALRKECGLEKPRHLV